MTEERITLMPVPESNPSAMQDADRQACIALNTARVVRAYAMELAADEQANPDGE